MIHTGFSFSWPHNVYLILEKIIVRKFVGRDNVNFGGTLADTVRLEVPVTPS
jgi:hypothetical protein